MQLTRYALSRAFCDFHFSELHNGKKNATWSKEWSSVRPIPHCDKTCTRVAIIAQDVAVMCMYFGWFFWFTFWMACPLKALDAATSDKVFLSVFVTGSMCFRPRRQPPNTGVMASQTRLVRPRTDLCLRPCRVTFISSWRSSTPTTHLNPFNSSFASDSWCFCDCMTTCLVASSGIVDTFLDL